MLVDIMGNHKMILSTIGKIKELVSFRKGVNEKIKFRTNLFRERKRDVQKAPDGNQAHT